MPVFKVSTNVHIEDKETFLIIASSLVASALGKPESYVMVSVSDQQNMSFAGTTDPLAYVELKSLGLNSNQTAELSQHICNFLQQQLMIDAVRVYIEFSSPERAMFGWKAVRFSPMEQQSAGTLPDV